MPTAVLRRRDADGRLVVGVPLSNRHGHHAWLYEADHTRLLNDYGDRPWFVNDNGKGTLYVRLRPRDRDGLVMVARAVVDDPSARWVRYRDGDTLNLRSANLDARRHNLEPSRTGLTARIIAAHPSAPKWAPPKPPTELPHVSRR